MAFHDGELTALQGWAGGAPLAQRPPPPVLTRPQVNSLASCHSWLHCGSCLEPCVSAGVAFSQCSDLWSTSGVTCGSSFRQEAAPAAEARQPQHSSSFGSGTASPSKRIDESRRGPAPACGLALPDHSFCTRCCPTQPQAQLSAVTVLRASGTAATAVIHA